MKHLYFTILLLAAVITANSQSNYAKDSQQKMQEFVQKFPSQQLKSTAADANALDSITFENGDIKKMTYNSNGLLLTFKIFENEDDKINLIETETNTYNESGQMLTSVVSRYDDWAKKIVDQWKYENTYNTLGRPVTEIEWLVTDEAPFELKYDSKTTYTYGDGTAETISYNWDNGEWQPDVKQTMFVRWDSETYPMVDSSHVFILTEGTSDDWRPAAKMFLTYSVDGQMSSFLTIGYNETGEERSKMKTETTSNAIGNILMETTEIYNQQTMAWELISKTEYEYNADNQIIREEDFSEDYWTGLFGPNYRMTYDYDTDGNLKMQQEYLHSGDEELVLFYMNDFTFKNLDTKSIMLPSSSIGYYGYDTDFYDEEFYKNGAIDEVKHYSYSYGETTSEELLEKTGKYHYSKHNFIGTAVEQLNNSSIKVYPNPFTNEIKLQLDKAGDYQLKIRNSIGQVVYSTNINGATTSHNVTQLPRGLYILSVFRDGENSTNYKLIKE